MAKRKKKIIKYLKPETTKKSAVSDTGTCLMEYQPSWVI